MKNVSENFSENVQKHFSRIFNYIQKHFDGNTAIFVKIISKCLKVPEFRWNSMISEMSLKKLFLWFLTFQRLSTISLKIISKFQNFAENREFRDRRLREMTEFFVRKNSTNGFMATN